MVKEKYETLTYTKTEKVMVSEKRYCDICEKEITGPHFEVCTGHHDWGNDSIDSIAHIDACSAECLSKVFLLYAERAEKYDGKNTEYLNIEHVRWSQVKGDIKYDPA